MMRMRCCFPQRFSLTAVCAVTFRFQSSNVGPFGGYRRTHEPLVGAVSSWLTEVKGGNVFAAHDADQTMLDAMQRYLDGSETKAPRCGEIPFKLSGSVEHDVLRHVFHRDREYDKSSANFSQQRTSLLCNSGFGGTGKTTLLYHTTVEAFRILKRMVGEHISIVTKDSAEEAKRAHEMRPLGFYVTFNTETTSGTADQKYLDTEKVPILTAIALRMAYSVVPSYNREIYRDFATRVAPYCDKSSDVNNFNSVVKALRSKLGWEGPMFIAIDEFRNAYGSRNSEERREGLSSVCEILLDGALPLLPPSPKLDHIVYKSYIAVSVYDAVDTLKLATISNRKLIAQAMPNLSVRDIAQLKFYPDSLDKSYIEILGEKRTKIGPLRPHQLLFLLHMALSTGTPRIMSMCLQRHAKDKIFNRGDKMTWYHADDLLDNMFWNLKIAKAVKDVKIEITEDMCVCVAQLVAGSTTVDIFDRIRVHMKYRVFALDPDLAMSCTVTDVASILQRGKKPKSLRAEILPRSPTRVLVSPSFLKFVLRAWPPSGCSATRAHMDALKDSLWYHTKLANALVRVGKTLVANTMKNRKHRSHLSVCDQLIGKWTNTTRVGFEQLTFEALCLHLSCILEDEPDEAKSVSAILNGVCSKVAETIIGAMVQGGTLERVDIPNFPSFFFDVYAAKDAELNDSDSREKTLNESLAAAKNALGEQKHNEYIMLKTAANSLSQKHPRITVPPSSGNTSYMRLRSALAKGNHFCFLPSNPNNQGEDGVVFLRNSGEAPTWTVLLFQCKFWFNDTQKVKGTRGKNGSQQRRNTVLEKPDGEVNSVVAKWRDSMGHLPATVVDAGGNEHTLRYVRILVTANPVEERHFTPLPKDSDEQAERIDLLGRANAAIVNSDAAMFDSLSELAGEWVDETRAKYDEAKKEYDEAKKTYEEAKMRYKNAEDLEKPPAEEPTPPLENEHLMAGERARELLSQLGVESSNGAMKRGEVLGECRMDLDKITQWCPTVGLFASNIIVIRDLAGDGGSDDAQGEILR
ncbi:multi-copy leucine-rich repeat protein, putative [Bodo saltans]|uniref:Multi-copy leucine-rich repeat protein, putative n=1 Tax=Bodo saltans TaxID=75058 RepID=A0A0S4JI15_BODSA|nr:multi-copy leucine-rich repeat protein, putative [Bodo saltans]|eukprot:CUG89102.1 multi-copy leucine-rich repeat protein, putative [Bodo saltans]